MTYDQKGGPWAAFCFDLHIGKEYCGVRLVCGEEEEFLDLQRLIPGSRCIVVSGDGAKIVWGLEQVLSGTKNQRFWSAAMLDIKPRSAIALFPAKVPEATKIFERGLDAADTAQRLKEVMQELVGGPLQYVRNSAHMLPGFEVRLAEKGHPRERTGLPVALVFAAMCPDSSF